MKKKFIKAIIGAVTCLALTTGIVLSGIGSTLTVHAANDLQAELDRVMASGFNLNVGDSKSLADILLSADSGMFGHLSNSWCFTISSVSTSDPSTVEVTGTGKEAVFTMLKETAPGQKVTIIITATASCGAADLYGSVTDYPLAFGIDEAGKEPENIAAPCNHNYVEETISDLSADSDGILVEKCSICGQEKDGSKVFVSAFKVFINDTIEKIQNAPLKSSLTIETDRWESFSQAVIDELAKRSDLTLELHYRHQGVKYTVIIPAGADLKVLEPADFYGFRYLDSKFPGSVRE